MKKIIVIVLVVIFIVIGLVLAAGQDEVIEIEKKTFNFSNLSINENDDAITVELLGTNTEFIQKDHYMIPINIETFVFPFGTKILNVECKTTGIKTEKLSKELMIAPDPVVIGQTLPYPKENRDIATINSWFEYNIGTGIVDNEHCVIVKTQLFPIQYYPFEGKLEWTEEIEIQIYYSEPEKSMVFNDEYDLVVLAPTEYSDELTSLISHKNNREISTKLVTLDEIYNSNYFPVHGRDEQEHIKYFIKDSIENWGITNVLLVGGATTFPVRSASIHIAYDPPMNREVASDLYYADIYDSEGDFSSWDSNDNDIFCEYNWGSERNTDEVDFFPDINIGRLACNTEEEVITCVNKIIAYESEEVYMEDWFTDLVVVGGDTFPEHGDEIDEGEYYTQGTIDLMEGFKPDKLWASKGKLSGDTGVENISNAINKGVGFVVFSGHGYPHLWMTHPHKDSSKSLPGPKGRYLNTDVSNLNNGDRLPIVILFACSNSDYNIPSCFGWSFLSNPSGGGIASFGSTDLAMGYIGSRIFSGVFGKITYDTLMGYRFMGARTLGEMWSYAVTKYIHTNSFDADILTTVEFHLFGDPTLLVTGDSTPPNKPDKPTGPISGKRNKEYTFSSSTIDVDGDDLFYRFYWGDEKYSDWMGPYPSGESVSASHIWSLKGDYQLKVIAKDINGVLGSWSDSLIVSMSKNKDFSQYEMMISKIIQKFPIIEFLLHYEDFIN